MTKISIKKQELKRVKALIRTGLFNAYEYDNCCAGYVLKLAKSFFEDEWVSLAYAQEIWQQQAFLNKLEPKFCNSLYILAIKAKKFIDSDCWEPFYNWLCTHYQKPLAEKIFEYVDEYKHIDGYMAYMPSTRELMYILGRNIFKK